MREAVLASQLQNLLADSCLGLRKRNWLGNGLIAPLAEAGHGQKSIQRQPHLVVGRFCDRPSLTGLLVVRLAKLESSTFFKVTAFESVLRNLLMNDLSLTLDGMHMAGRDRTDYVSGRKLLLLPVELRSDFAGTDPLKWR